MKQDDDDDDEDDDDDDSSEDCNEKNIHWYWKRMPTVRHNIVESS
jgi:hypothetical protein